MPPDAEHEGRCQTARDGITLTILLFVLERIGGEPQELQGFRAAWTRGDSYNLHAHWNVIVARFRSLR